MVANNTSAFNCREVAGSPGVLSQHALGTAIDVEPADQSVGAFRQGRSARRRHSTPTAALPWKGAIYADDVVVRAFAAIGWSWGGYWPGSYDYQHFAAGG